MGAAPWENPVALHKAQAPHVTANFWGQPATYIRKMPLEGHSSSFRLLMGQSSRKARLYPAVGTGGAQV